MWSLLLLVVSKVLTAYGIPEISLICEDTLSAIPEGFSTDATACPSILDALEVHVIPYNGHRGYRMLNVSWAVNIDASINYLKGTWIVINNDDRYNCKYLPPLTEVNVRGAKQLWFHHLVPTDPGIMAIISVFNVPIPPYGGGDYSKGEMLEIPDDEHSTSVPTVKPTSVRIPPSLPKAIHSEFIPTDNVLMVCIGCATGLLVLACYITLVKVYRRLSNSPFTELPNSPPVQVLVLVVYPAGNPVFQRAVVAFAEFLKWHEGCHVSIDMWQSRQLAEQGPMHWLAERAMSADRVLVISPQTQSTSFPSSGPTGVNTVPAATHDLFPLVLNMVASLARSPSDMAKFWVVQLGKAQEKGGLPVELRGCRGFCLMNDLGKLCRQLRQLQQGSSGAWVRSRPGPGYNEKDAGKLREAVENIGMLGKSPQQGGSGRAAGEQQAL